MPRPYGPAPHGTGSNDLLQFDYIEVAPAATGEKYVLMLRDDHSSYCWLFAFADTMAENATRAVIDWCAALGVPHGLIADGLAHFQNETLPLVCKGLRVPHQFTLPYTPWSKCGVEQLGKELLRVFRPVTTELRLRPDECLDLFSLVRSILNNTPSPQRAGLSPLKAMTGVDETAQLLWQPSIGPRLLPL